jgi:hypothetical protein
MGRADGQAHPDSPRTHNSVVSDGPGRGHEFAPAWPGPNTSSLNQTCRFFFLHLMGHAPTDAPNQTRPTKQMDCFPTIVTPFRYTLVQMGHITSFTVLAAIQSIYTNGSGHDQLLHGQILEAELLFLQKAYTGGQESIAVLDGK